MKNFINHVILNKMLCLRYKWRKQRNRVEMLIKIEKTLWNMGILTR